MDQVWGHLNAYRGHLLTSLLIKTSLAMMYRINLCTSQKNYVSHSLSLALNSEKAF